MSENLNSYQITPGLTTEQLKAEFFDEDALQVQPKPLYRLDHSKGRYYYEFIDDKPVMYQSVTTLISRSLPTSPQLINWKVSMGAKDADKHTSERAHYGTFMHICFGELAINKTINLDTIQGKMAEYAHKHNLYYDWVIDNVEDIKRDILAFVQWLIDYRVKILAVELVLAHPDGYAGAIDLVCELEVECWKDCGEVYKSGARKGQVKLTKGTKRIKAIVDFKSGRKGFYEAHKIQLHAYLNLWNYNMKHLQIERVFNWAPKAWRLKPAYSFAEQTNEKVLKKFPHLLACANIDDEIKDKSLVVLTGVVTLDQNSTENIQHLTLAQAVERAAVIEEENQEPKEAEEIKPINEQTTLFDESEN
jgi:hypothetical protein